jgi:DNA polymerase-3 subunit gamma/tau
MGKALYREYRSTSFDEVIGQDHITTTLKNSLKNGTIAHAYLLTGPRGVGKTSIARILAYAVNDLPYQKDGNHLDIIEIDAASNRRIDEIRSLRERVHIAPTSAKYKVYIIDEVHMLTKEAFNALLKTLEEPPDHVIFILATTEIHKLPDTIVSRCITFTFRPIDDASIVKHLKHIAEAEGLKVTSDALELLAVHGDGSFRDSISLLDQIKNISDQKIDRPDIELALGLAPDTLIGNMLAAVAAGQPKDLDAALQQAYQHGASETNIAKQLAALVRSQLLSGKLSFPALQTTQLLRELLSVPASAKPKAALELCLLSLLFTIQPDSAVISAPIKMEPTPAKPEKKAEPVAEAIVEIKLTEDEPQKAAQKVHAETKAAPVKFDGDTEIWDSILQKLKMKNNTLYGIARMAEADHQDGKLILVFDFPFHFKQVTQPKNKSIITAIMDELGHNRLVLDITLKTDKNKPAQTPAKKQSSDHLESINDIFGSGEVLES